MQSILFATKSKGLQKLINNSQEDRKAGFCDLMFSGDIH